MLAQIKKWVAESPTENGTILVGVLLVSVVALVVCLLVLDGLVAGIGGVVFGLLIVGIGFVLSQTMMEQAEQRSSNMAVPSQADITRSMDKQARGLAVNAEIGRRLTTILDEQQLVREVVEQVRTAFQYYHVHIYLMDDVEQKLVMMGGTGEAGQAMLARGHDIEMGSGLVGRAAAHNEVVLVPDVQQEPGWLANVLLPDTRAEVAVPIALGEEVLGVLDVQQNETNSLGTDDATLLESLANQVAIALQNARLYQKTERKARYEALINSLGERIQTASSVDDVLRVATRELGRQLHVEKVSIQLSGVQTDNETI